MTATGLTQTQYRRPNLTTKRVCGNSALNLVQAAGEINFNLSSLVWRRLVYTLTIFSRLRLRVLRF